MCVTDTEDCDFGFVAVDDGEPWNEITRYLAETSGIPVRVPVTGAARGRPVAITTDLTASTAYVLLEHFNGQAFQDTIMSVPIGGGAAQTVVTLPLNVIGTRMVTHPGSGHLWLTTFRTPGLVRVDPFQRTFSFVSTPVPGETQALAFEEATGDLIQADFNGFMVGVRRQPTSSGAAQTIRQFLTQVPSGLFINHTPARFGSPHYGDFGVDWDLPPRRPPTVAANDLPTAGNSAFLWSLSTGGFDLFGAIGIATGRTPTPGLPFQDVRLHIDPARTVVFLPVSGGAVVRVPRAIPAGVGGATLYAQGFFFDDSGYLVTTSGLKTTVVP